MWLTILQMEWKMMRQVWENSDCSLKTSKWNLWTWTRSELPQTHTKVHKTTLTKRHKCTRNHWPVSEVWDALRNTNCSECPKNAEKQDGRFLKITWPSDKPLKRNLNWLNLPHPQQPLNSEFPFKCLFFLPNWQIHMITWTMNTPLPCAEKGKRCPFKFQIWISI